MTTASRDITPTTLKQLRILVVDPNTYLRGVVADAMRRLQIVNIAGAATAMEAFTLARKFKPDLIIVDWDAGKMSGLEFTREVRRNSSGLPRETPIILLSAAIDQEQLLAARQAGINEFLLKPISAQTVLARIEEVILKPRRFIISRNYVGPCRRRRDDPEYVGPWRRLTDEITSNTRQGVTRENTFRLRAIIDNLTAFADENTGDRTAAIRGMYRLLNEYAEEVRVVGDETIARVWTSGVRYVEGVGMTDHYDLDVIRYHFQTIGRILDMPEEEAHHRVAVANELERLVTKKIQGIGVNAA